ncbi:Os02g0772650, partial [Oryza sativa Japonica Group]
AYTAGLHANWPTGCRTGLAGRFRILWLTSFSVAAPPPSNPSGLTTANGYSTPVSLFSFPVNE